MRRLAKLSLLVASVCLGTTVHAVDRGQYKDVPDNIRTWFKSVVAPNGVPCCDESDGHRTAYDMRDGSYWVPIEGEWLRVPERAIIRDAGNPVGDAVVWWVRHQGKVIIACFVPGPGA